MPSAEEIQSYLVGAWRLMNGKPEAIRMFDLSADGFWNSFYAILIAVPALTVGWATVASEVGDGTGGRVATVVLLGVIDISTWVLPLVAFAFLSRPLGVGDRFVAYVVAGNWGSALLVWIMLPPALIRLVFPGWQDAATLLSIAVFVVSLALTWRLTNAVIDRGAALATGVFALMLAMSIAVLVTLQGLFGIEMPAAG